MYSSTELNKLSKDLLIKLIHTIEAQYLEKIKTLETELEPIWADDYGYCDCGCGKYYYTSVIDSGYWCNTCKKKYYWAHKSKDEYSGDICTICGTSEFN